MIQRARRIAPLLQYAVEYHHAGKLANARRACEKALRDAPWDADAHHLLGLVLIDERKTEKGLRALRRAVELRPDYAAAINNLAIELSRQGYHPEAETYFNQALALDASIPELHHNMALCLRALGRTDVARTALDQALKLRTDFPAALRDRAALWRDAGNFADAIADDMRALDLNANDPIALRGLAESLLSLHRPKDALARLEQSLRIAPDDADTLSLHAAVLITLRRTDQALAGLERALRIQPNHVGALVNQSAALVQSLRPESALPFLERALRLHPADRQLECARANLLSELQRHAEAAAGLSRLVADADSDGQELGLLLNSRMFCCDWTDYQTLCDRIEVAILAGHKADRPFSFLAHSTSAAVQRACAELRAPRGTKSGLPARARRDRIRLAYVSADFRDHVAGHLMAPLMESHDQARFEVIGVSLRPSDDSDTARRCQTACAQFVDISRMDDPSAVAFLRRLDIDIAVDLMGHTAHGRPGLFAERIAPVQVGFLGYAGTFGGDALDVILADRHLIRPADEQHYSERVVRLPDTVYPTEPSPKSNPPPPRTDLGLAANEFIFCCHNNSYKITPLVFAAWMRILRRVPASQMWLLRSNDDVARNLRREAAAQGIDPARLVFADRVERADYLGRFERADLFLDTQPFTACTTAAHALWMSLPVVTIDGPTFVGRMGASQLHAIGLADLIAPDLDAYEELAVGLAHSPERMMEVRSRLARHINSYPLFDHQRHTRNLEAAFTAMLSR